VGWGEPDLFRSASEAEVETAAIEASTNPPDCVSLQSYSVAERKK